MKESQNPGVKERRNSGVKASQTPGVKESQNPGERRNSGVRERRNPGGNSIDFLLVFPSGKIHFSRWSLFAFSPSNSSPITPQFLLYDAQNFISVLKDIYIRLEFAYYAWYFTPAFQAKYFGQNIQVCIIPDA